MVITPAPQVPGRKPPSLSSAPAAQKPTRKGKEKDEHTRMPPVRGASRGRSKATTTQTASETNKSTGKARAKAAEPNEARASSRTTSSPGPSLPENREVHTEDIDAEQPGGLSVIMEEETSSAADREKTQVEGITALVDSLPSTMSHPARRPPRARGGKNLASIPHSAVEALHIQLARQDSVIADLQSEIKHLSSQFAVASSVTGKQVDLSNVLDQATLQTSKSVLDVQSKLQGMVESLSSRVKTLEDTNLRNRVNDLEARMDEAQRELKEQRSDLVLLDKAAEVLYAQNKQLESRPLAGRVVAYGAPSLPEHLKRKHGNSEEADAPQERPTKIFITPGLAPGTRQWVEEGPSGLKIHTQTGLEPLEAAYRREFGQ